MIFILTALLAVAEPFVIIGPGAISAADPGVLERVAERRVQANWGLSDDWTAYDVLTATADCRDLGKRGWLIANRNVYKAIVVDCAQEKHRQEMTENGLLLDANMESLNHLEGWLILR